MASFDLLIGFLEPLAASSFFEFLDRFVVLVSELLVNLFELAFRMFEAVA